MTNAQLRVFARVNGCSSLVEARALLDRVKDKDAAQQTWVKGVLESEPLNVIVGKGCRIPLKDAHIVLDRMGKPGVSVIHRATFDNLNVMNIAVCKPRKPVPCAAWLSQEGEQYVVAVNSGMKRIHEFIVEVDTDHGWLMQICAASPRQTLAEDERDKIAFIAMSSIPRPYGRHFRAPHKCVSVANVCPTNIGVPVAYVDEKEIH